MIRLAVRVRREDAELVLAELLELAPSGVEEAVVGEELVEYAVYGAPGELPELPEVRAAVGGALVEITTDRLADDWSERWRRFHRPVLIEAPGGHAKRDGDHADRVDLPALYVRPPWERPTDHPDAREIVIDPAQAFGTGSHATTRLCLELLLELAATDSRRGPMLDVGTGSGVLAIAGAHLGFVPILGLDNELESVRAAEANAQVNGVGIEVRHFDLRAEPLPPAPGEEWGLVTANLLRPLLLDLAQGLLVAPQHLLASGLLGGEVDEVVRAFEDRVGLREQARRHGGEWAAVWFAR